MSVINQFKLKNNSNNKEIKFHWAESVNTNITINNVTLDAAGQTSDNNYVSNFGGFKRLKIVDFALFNDGSDKSTDASSIVTLTQQKDFLLDEVVEGTAIGDSVSDITYTLTTYSDGTTSTITGGIDNISVDEAPSNAGTIIRGTVTLIRGSN